VGYDPDGLAGVRAPGRRRFAIGAVLLAVPLIVIVVQLPAQLRGLYDSIRNGEVLTRQQRLLMPAQVNRVRYTDVFAKAAAIIPPRAGFSRVYPADAFNTALFAKIWLMPRRADVGGPGTWIVDWGTPPRKLALHGGKVVELAPGVWVIGPVVR